MSLSCRKRHAGHDSVTVVVSFSIFYLSLAFKLGANWMMFECCSNGERWKTIYAPMPRRSTRHSIGPERGHKLVWPPRRRVSSDHCRSELEPINTHDYCRVIWPGNQCQLHSFPLKTKAKCYSQGMFICTSGYFRAVLPRFTCGQVISLEVDQDG